MSEENKIADTNPKESRILLENIVCEGSTVQIIQNRSKGNQAEEKHKHEKKENCQKGTQAGPKTEKIKHGISRIMMTDNTSVKSTINTFQQGSFNKSIYEKGNWHYESNLKTEQINEAGATGCIIRNDDTYINSKREDIMGAGLHKEDKVKNINSTYKLTQDKVVKKDTSKQEEN